MRDKIEEELLRLKEKREKIMSDLYVTDKMQFQAEKYHLVQLDHVISRNEIFLEELLKEAK